MTPELWITFAGIIINALVLIVVALIGRNQKIEHDKTEAREKVRAQESRLSMDLMEATAECADVIAYAQAGGQLNGNVEAARERVRVARDNYHTFLHEQAAANVAKG